VNITIIFNPVAGAQKHAKLTRAVRAFTAQGINPLIRETEKRGDACDFAREEAGRGSDIVVAAGGDGTINEVANGLAGSRVKLGILPMGVANLLALEMRLPHDPASAVDVIMKGIPQLINPGYVLLRDADTEQEIKRYFLLMAGVGFDGGVMHDIRRNHIESWGKAAYVVAGMRFIAKYTNTLFTIRIDRQQMIDAYSAVIGKSRFYGGSFMVTPRASLKDDCLDICAFQEKGALNMIKHAVGVLTGSHPRKTGIYYGKQQELEITSENKVYVQVDGDFLGCLPACFGVHKAALSIIAPA
jgi:YegS/Rv2252/BmrU family lipid kinase